MTESLRFSDLIGSAKADAEAACDPAGRTTYGALAIKVDAVAAYLVGQGVKPGDRVGLMAHAGIGYWAHFLGTVKAGAIWFGLNPKYRDAELVRAIEDARPAFVHYDPDCADAAQIAAMRDARFCPVEPLAITQSQNDRFQDRSDPALPSLLVFTSGSSGRPKGALISQAALIRAAKIRNQYWATGPIRTLVNVPINHIGCVGDLCCSTLLGGGFLAFQPRYDAAGGLDIIEREQLNYLYQVPAQLDMALAAQAERPRDLSSLAFVAWSGGAASEALVNRLDALFPGKIATDYSSTESVGPITLSVPGVSAKTLVGMAGWPVPERRFALSDAGEVSIPADHVFSGYLDQPDATAAALKGQRFHTGDIGETRAGDGALRLVGRMSDMFKSGGYNVYPREIEIILEAQPAVRRAAVVARADDRWGEVGIACVEVVAGETLNVDALMTTLKAALANYKVPKSIVILPSLPLLPIGKVDKKSLKDQIGAQSA
jgi:acyl-CoA synthetase (AMP-forming)/AMP-acid ligase II